jgi:PAS domain S-box-containing protein
MNKNFIQKMVFSLLIPCIACAIQWVFWDKFQPFIWFLFYPAVFFSAQIGGRWGGIAATLLSVFLAVFFFVEPAFSLQISRVNTLYSVTVFILMGFLFSGLQENRRRGQQKLQESESTLRALNAEMERRAEADLNQALERLDLATAAAEIGIWDWDIQTNQLVWDKRMYELYGITPAEFPGAYQAWLNGIHPDDREASNEISQQAVRGEKEYDTEFRVLWPDGSVHWLKANGQVFRNEHGQATRMVGVNYEITGRKRLEESLRESEQKYTLLFEKSTVPTAVLKLPEVVIIDANEACEKLTGFTRQEMFGKTSVQLGLFGTEQRKELISSFEHRGKLTGNEIRLFTKNGGERSVVANTTPVKISGETYAITTMQDITDRKQAEEALREREQKLNTILNLLPVGISILDQDRNVVYSNDALGKILGTTNEGLLQGAYRSRKYLRANGSEKPAEEFASSRAFTERIELHDIVTGVVKEDGQTIWTNVSAAPVDFPDWKVILVTADITERMRAEEELHQSEEFLRLAYEAADLGIWKNDLQTGSVEFDERARLHYGFDTLYTTISEVTSRVHPEDLARLGAEIATATDPTGSGKFATEYRVIHPDGSVHWLAIGVQVAFKGEGEQRHPVMGYGTSLDITERKQAEAALRQSEQKYSALFEKAAVPAALTKMPEGVFADVNEAFQTSFGYSREELLGKTSVEVGMARADERAQSYLNLEKYGVLRNNEKHLFTKSGETRIGAVNINRVMLNGQAYVITTIHDVTERKRAEETLRQRTEEMEQLLNLLPAAIWIADDPECKVIHGNRFANELLGVTEEDNISQSAEAPRVKLRQFAQGQELGPDELPMQAAARTGQPQFNFELQIDRPDHLTHTLLGGAVPLFDPAGRPRGVVSAFQDITERKQAEDELRRSNAELEQFAYVASHDLQEPLRAVAGMVQLLSQRYQGKLDERADEYIGHAVEASQRMQNLINDLLDYSRVGRFGQPFVSTTLENSLKTALANLEAVIQENRAQITADPLPTVVADPRQLTQVFQNLIGNALKFRGENPPQIRISAKKVEGDWQIAVRDNGIGIEPQYFERIFLVFQRLHTRREYPGTGIGLSLCKKIIERHGGKIWVESQPGQGSTFYFTLPEKK